MAGIGRKHLATMPADHTWVGGAARATLRTQSHNARDPMEAPGELRRSLQSQVTIPVRRAEPGATPAGAGPTGIAPIAEHPVMRRSASEPWRRTCSDNGRTAAASAAAEAATTATPETVPEAQALEVLSNAQEPPRIVEEEPALSAAGVGASTKAQEKPASPVEKSSAVNAAVVTEPPPLTALGQTEASGKGNIASAGAVGVAVTTDADGSVSNAAVAGAAGTSAAESLVQAHADQEEDSSTADKQQLSMTKQQIKRANKKKGGKQEGSTSAFAAAAAAPLATSVATPGDNTNPTGASVAELAAAVEAAALSQAAAAARASSANSKDSPSRKSATLPAANKAEAAMASAGSSTSVNTDAAAGISVRAAAKEAASTGHSHSSSNLSQPHSRSNSIGAGMAAARGSPPLTPGGSTGGGLQAYDRYSELLFRLQQFLPALKAKATQNADFEATWEVLKAELSALVAAAKYAAQQAARLEALDQEVEKLQRLLGLIGREVKSNVLQQQLKEIFKESPLQPAAKAANERSPRATAKPTGPSTTFGNYPAAMSRSSEPGRPQRAAPAPAKVITPTAAAKLDHMYRSINRTETSPKRLGYKVLAVKTSAPQPALERRSSGSPTAAAITMSPRRSYSAVLPGPTLAELASFAAAREAFLSVTSPKGPRTERWLQSLVPKPLDAKANSAAAVDKAMSQLKKSMKDNSVPLELTRIAPFTYEAAGKRMNIKQQATGLVVRKGGGYEDLLTVLGRMQAPGLATGRSMDKTDMASLLRVASGGSGGMLMGAAHESFSVFSSAPVMVAA